MTEHAKSPGAAQDLAAPDETWPQPLREVVDFANRQPLPMVILWGDEPTAVANEAGRRLLADVGEKPAVLPISREDYERARGGASFVIKARGFENSRGGVEAAVGPLAPNGALVSLIEHSWEAPAEIGSGGVVEASEPQGPDLRISARWCEILGFRREDLPPPASFASWFAERVHPDDVTARGTSLERFLTGKEELYEAEFRVRDRSGDWTWVREHARATERDESGGVRRYIAVMQDITKRKAAEIEAERRARHDPLTGLPSRSLFRERFAAALQESLEAREQIGVALINLDRFAVVNERFGSEIGDAVLREVGQRLVSDLRRSELVARLGDDEFCAVLPNLESPEDLQQLARRLAQRIAKPIQVQGHQVAVTACIGAAAGPEHGQETTMLLRNSDFALRKAQQIGPGEVYIFEPAILAGQERRRTIEAELRRGIENGELVLHYQPSFDAATLAPLSIEALVRWRKSQAELLHPRHFMDLARESGLIVPLGEWVLGEVARQLAEWAGHGIALPATINVSHAEVVRPEFFAAFDAAISQHGIPSERIEFEINHTVLIDHESMPVQKFIAGCRRRQIALVMDDYGVGYSSSGYLQTLTIDKVKIDATFVAGAANEDGDALLRIMIGEGHRLARQVVAEGVETESQLAALRELGCDEVQGNLLCPAGPPDAVVTRLSEQPDRATPEA